MKYNDMYVLLLNISNVWFSGSKVQDNSSSCIQNVITTKIIFVDFE